MQPTADSLRLLKREAFHCGYPSQKDNGGGYTNLPETFQKVSECILNERNQLVCHFWTGVTSAGSKSFWCLLKK